MINKETKICGKCLVIKPVVEFAKRTASIDGYKSFCKACNKVWRVANCLRISETDKVWYANNKERKQECTRLWKLANPLARLAVNIRYRANKLESDDVSVTIGYLLYLRDIQQNRCVYCLDELPYVGAHLDHIVPLSRGGLHSIGNVVYTCQFCNLSKGAKLLNEWLVV